MAPVECQAIRRRNQQDSFIPQSAIRQINHSKQEEETKVDDIKPGRFQNGWVSMRTKVRAILFDLDGTLLNTIRDIGIATNHALKEHNLPGHNLKAYRDMVGGGLRNLVEQSLQRSTTARDNIPNIVNVKESSDKSLIDNVLKSVLHKYNECCCEYTKPYPGITDLLKELAALKIPMSILSNKDHDLTVKIVSKILEDHKFEVVLGAREGIPKKPNPQSTLEVSEKMNISPVNFLFVGDTSADVQAAKASKMEPVGVSWGYRSIEHLKQAGVKNIINHPLELLDLIV